MEAELLVAGGDPSSPFDALEEVLDVMSLTVPSAIPRSRLLAIAPWRNTRQAFLIPDPLPERITIIALVGDDSFASRESDGLRGRHVPAGTAGQGHFDGSPLTIHQGGDLGVDPTLGFTDRFGCLMPTGTGILMNLYVGGVQVAELAALVLTEAL